MGSIPTQPRVPFSSVHNCDDHLNTSHLFVKNCFKYVFVAAPQGPDKRMKELLNTTTESTF